jgi:hypothetical protein
VRDAMSTLPIIPPRIISIVIRLTGQFFDFHRCAPYTTPYETNVDRTLGERLGRSRSRRCSRRRLFRATSSPTPPIARAHAIATRPTSPHVAFNTAPPTRPRRIAREANVSSASVEGASLAPIAARGSRAADSSFVGRRRLVGRGIKK